MGKYEHVVARTGWGVPGRSDTARTAEQVSELIDLSRDPDPKAQRIAVANLCSCHVRADFPQVWDRVFEMVDDPDPLVRRSVVHMLADGSPRYRASEVAQVLHSMRNDADRVVRRQAQTVLRVYNRTGRINIL